MRDMVRSMVGTSGSRLWGLWEVGFHYTLVLSLYKISPSCNHRLNVPRTLIMIFSTLIIGQINTLMHTISSTSISCPLISYRYVHHLHPSLQISPILPYAR